MTKQQLALWFKVVNDNVLVDWEAALYGAVVALFVFPLLRSATKN
jgi:hypothetical protein